MVSTVPRRSTTGLPFSIVGVLSSHASQIVSRTKICVDHVNKA
jgi:hypothetical protein